MDYCHAKVSIITFVYLTLKNAAQELPEDKSLLGRETAWHHTSPSSSSLHEGAGGEIKSF